MLQARRDMPRGGENTKKTDFSAFSAVRDLFRRSPSAVATHDLKLHCATGSAPWGKLFTGAAAGLAVMHAPDLVWL
jgi:hypothetical protein